MLTPNAVLMENTSSFRKADLSWISSINPEKGFKVAIRIHVHKFLHPGEGRREGEMEKERDRKIERIRYTDRQINRQN